MPMEQRSVPVTAWAEFLDPCDISSLSGAKLSGTARSGSGAGRGWGWSWLFAVVYGVLKILRTDLDS